MYVHSHYIKTSTLLKETVSCLLSLSRGEAAFVVFFLSVLVAGVSRSGNVNFFLFFDFTNAVTCS